MQGVWEFARAMGAATLRIQPYWALAARERDALAGEGARLLAFVAMDAASHDSQFTSVD